MHTVFFLVHHISQQLMQMPIAQTLTFIFATTFAVHGLTHVARIYIPYLIITLFVAKMGSPGCTSPATPKAAKGVRGGAKRPSLSPARAVQVLYGIPVTARYTSSRVKVDVQSIYMRRDACNRPISPPSEAPWQARTPPAAARRC